MDITQLVTIIGVVVANLSTTILLFLWSTNHASEDRRKTDDILYSIQEEMKDFHERMVKIETEYKQHLMYQHSNVITNKQ